MSTSRFDRGKRGLIWGEPAPGERKPKFTREQIANVAIEIADKEGFDAVSMRRIADELGAGTMTLYHYVRTKEDLMALMDDQLTASILVPPEQMPTNWRAALHLIAVSSYRAFMRHPWALGNLKGVRFGPNAMRHVEQSLAAVADAPFDQQGRIDALGIVDDYVFGHVMRVVENTEQEGMSGVRPMRALIKFAEQMIATGDFPHMEKMVSKGPRDQAWETFGRFMNDPGRFLRGLDVILDGLEARAQTKKSR